MTLQNRPNQKSHNILVFFKLPLPYGTFKLDIYGTYLCRYKNEGNARDLQKLIQMIRPFTKLLSKAKAAKLVRGLVDL